MNTEETKQEIKELWTMYYEYVEIRDWMSCDFILNEIYSLENKLKDSSQ